jgi:starch synthase
MSHRVLMITSELFPLAKAGGLADAAADISVALAARGHDVRIVMPRYYFINREELDLLPVSVQLEAGGQTSVYQTRLGKEGDGVIVYLIDAESAYGRDGIYLSPQGEPYEDNAWRFSLLSRAALELSRSLGWKPDIFHAHDWPAGLVPAYLGETPYEEWFAGAASVFTIHNLGYQGTFPFEAVGKLGLSPETVLASGLVAGDHINFLRCALTSATALTTVSPTYAREITDAEHGFGLDPVVRAHPGGVRGILNGINYEVWNPAADPLLPFSYDADSLDGKRLLARVLRWYVGLPQQEDRPIIGMVTRLVEQKGFGELLSERDPALVRILTRTTAQVVILGSGPAARESLLHELADSFPNLSVTTGFDNRLAHLIEAGSDFFLMPSQYEPCGLNQMYSLRYGTVPIVTRTGGLADTVVDVRQHPEAGTGYLMERATSREIFDTVAAALEDHSRDPARLRAMRVRGMRERFTWDAAAAAYEQVYEEARAAASSP